MSSNWLLNARRYGQTFGKKFKNLENSFNSKVTNDSVDEGEDQQARTEGNVGRSYLKFCDDQHNYGSTLTPDYVSYLAFEPDFVHCRLYVEFDSIGGQIHDYSGFNHYARSYGITRVQKGIDYGRGGSIEIVFDGRSAYAEVTHTGNVDFSNASAGFSLQFRFMPFSLSNTGGSRPVVVCKKESLDDWYSCELYPNGRLGFNLVKGGSIRSIVTDAGDIVVNEHHDVAVTYSQSSGDLELFVNNEKFDTADNALPSGTQTPITDSMKLKIGRYDPLVAPPPGEKYPMRADSKLYYGAFQQLKYWRNKILTDAEVEHHYINKLTIADIPFGLVASANGDLICDE